MSRNRLAIASLLLIATLAGCMPFGRPDPLRIVAPAPSVAPAADWPRVEWSLLVQRPVADQTRGSVRVVVRTGGAQLAYYPGIAWLDELPEMLQSELLRAFTDSGRIDAVARPGVARARYALASEIRRFDAVEEAPGSLVVELEVQAGLLEVRNGELPASRVFRSRMPVDGRDAEALTAAFEGALGELIGELVGWTLTAPPDAAAEHSPGP